MKDEMEIEIFRAGDYGEKGQWGEAELDAIAADYDPALHEAPVTMDHAQSGPALGWVASVRKVGDRLVARLRKLNGKLMDLIGEGAFRKRSVELYPALHETGRPYLRAVSFLGAAVPEVKGLADPVATAEGVALFSDDERETVAVAMEEEAGEREAEKQPDEKPDEGFELMRERLRMKGCWRPDWDGLGVREFYGRLSETGEVNVADGRRLLAVEWFEDFLGRLPEVVAMGEFAGVQGRGDVASFADTTQALLAGGAFDATSLELHRTVVSYRQSHPETSYAEALARCAPRG